MLQDLAARLQEEHMRNEALLFALKQHRDTGAVPSVAAAATSGTVGRKAAHDPCAAPSTVAAALPGERSTADVGVQMVHSQVFALDAIIQCKIADDERAQNSTICSICGGTAEEALEGELTLALGLADQRIAQRKHTSDAFGMGGDGFRGHTAGQCEAARVQLSEMTGELQQLHESLTRSMRKLLPAQNKHAWDQKPDASVLLQAAAESVDLSGGQSGVASGAPVDSGACFVYNSYLWLRATSDCSFRLVSASPCVLLCLQSQSKRACRDASWAVEIHSCCPYKPMLVQVSAVPSLSSSMLKESQYLCPFAVLFVLQDSWLMWSWHHRAAPPAWGSLPCIYVWMKWISSSRKTLCWRLSWQALLSRTVETAPQLDGGVLLVLYRELSS